ncbi:MAG: helix-turn-helix domain-containing protein [Paenibacillus macerans]|uniref:Transcriptional regulator n=1 Tax=Paenibacillus macerans TaxID=44252 RepID=A0A6N8F2U2_PAEMA|nr:helix-turn-helix domain-containing protein [Paenibacillus macerans]MBS5910215.1 helix-turn-helix transcriptional regulator [Paenibacillus macerans]MCY7559818.1 helix-turn-helix transcriptional regulator [Paenibacillus macerans]MDU5949092.1 helix-turn-helix domain-containing protein [Paenibacillus macerans]MDU7476317.1 helix-turn-helix domain-containing protein [Paenibacillus macerans]MEC0137565.1 helix-turn-helix domain-containing protein [Paenibacillus macerans]
MSATNSTEACSSLIDGVLKILSGKWSLPVLAELVHGKKRFNQLKRSLGNVNAKALSDTLKHLESHGIIQRQVVFTVPVTVEYSLTEKGQSFRAVFHEMGRWGEQWNQE